ncbi:PQ loop repeat-domain-containing protein [Hysterangium stoloniferum]|nr:PQ loop repeat-domain-containing protein [Hysterangium stoloniferum]
MYNDPTVASSVLGWLSIGCWLIVYTPQFIENYTRKSGEGLSVFFVVIWLIGDITNLLGALIASLIPTVIILAVYYTLCDIGLLFQIFYYRKIHHVSPAEDMATVLPTETETAPLLPKDTPESPLYTRVLRQLLPYVLGTCFVLTIGGISYCVNTHEWGHPRDPAPREDVFEWKSQLFGWISAVLYLGSRVPQILKNFTTKCVGLSPVLFFFAITGNVTYVASILVISTDGTYLAVNAPWLAGSGLTVFLDIFVLSQFIYYRWPSRVFVPGDA